MTIHELTILLCLGLLVGIAFLIPKLSRWYTAWLDSDHDEESGMPKERLPLGESLLQAVRAPGERQRQEKARQRQKLENIPAEERAYVNPFGKDIWKALLLCLLPPLVFAVLVGVYRSFLQETDAAELAKNCMYVLIPFLALLTGKGILDEIAALVGYFSFRAFKMEHPGKQFDYEYYLMQMKATNGGYKPSDFGK